MDKFLSTLKKLNFDKIDELAKYLYSDGTNDNTITKRMKPLEYKKSWKRNS